MLFAGSVNFLAVVLAMVASMALGAAWYMPLGPAWMKALGKTKDDLMAAAGGPALPFVWAGALQLVSAYFLASLLAVVPGGVSVANGIALGLFVGVGLVLTSMLTHHRYEGAAWSLALINGGYSIAVLAVQGLVIGLFG